MSTGTEADEQDHALLRVEPYDDTWALAYASEANKLQEAVGQLIVEVEHVRVQRSRGSTRSRFLTSSSLFSHGTASTLLPDALRVLGTNTRHSMTPTTRGSSGKVPWIGRGFELITCTSPDDLASAVLEDLAASAISNIDLSSDS